jgi:hypothetical protein
MSQSITQSIVNAPFNGLILTDATFDVSASYGVNGVTASTPSVNFLVPMPWPVNSHGVVNVYANSPTTATSSSISLTLQESADNVTWQPCVNLANPILTATGSVSQVSGNVVLQYGGLQFLRLSAVSPAGAYPTGSFGFNVYFRA